MGSTAAPAGRHLFVVRKNADNIMMLQKEKAISFYHHVAKLLFVSSYARRDIQPPMAFYTTHFKGPNDDDWGKLNG